MKHGSLAGRRMLDGVKPAHVSSPVSAAPIVTMRSIAQAAGVTQPTVSKALRNDPALPAARCAEIQELARRLGYRPNPLVSALMAQLHQQRRRADPHHLAWLDLWTKADDPTKITILKPLFRGACRRADELGYSIEVHRVRAGNLTPRRLRQILTARAQWGLIIPPVPETAMRFPLDMRALTGVTIGTSLHEPVLHRISPNHFQGGLLACEKLRAKGFRRPGLVLSHLLNERVDGKWLGAYLAAQQHWPATERLPPLLTEPTDQPTFDAWRRRYRPDALLIAEPHALAWSCADGEHLPVAWLVRDIGQKYSWGIDYQAEQIGAVAVELVIGQIHRNERGCPAIPHSLLMDGIWAED